MEMSQMELYNKFYRIFDTESLYFVFMVIAIAHCWTSYLFYRSNKSRRDLQDEVMREKSLRMHVEKNWEQDRIGRINAEKALKQLNTSTQDIPLDDMSYTFSSIGTLRSVFKQRNGTPRQGMLALDARATLKTAIGVNGSQSLSNLNEYSHVWLIFVFHANTNSARKIKLDALKSQPKTKKNISKVKSKVHPPRLNGEKVGLFATRTPHRPNPIGLSVAKLEAVDLATGTIHLSGIDLIDGTPILDIKPYIPYSDSFPHAIFPSWIDNSSLVSFGDIEWQQEATDQLTLLVAKLEFYKTVEEFKRFVGQVLAMGTEITFPCMILSPDMRLDNVQVHFEYRENRVVRVTKINFCTENEPD